jgi:hypothetical protein
MKATEMALRCWLLAILSGLCFPLSLICHFLCNFNQCNSGVALS